MVGKYIGIWLVAVSIVSLFFLHRGSYMSAHVLLDLLNQLGKVIKCKAC